MEVQRHTDGDTPCTVMAARLNLNIALIQTKCSGFRFNLTKVNIHNTYHVIVFPEGAFFLFRFNEIECNT